jgi:murein DD-endopeptidase MepM/ murein hydrolase activator NlpD
LLPALVAAFSLIAAGCAARGPSRPTTVATPPGVHHPLDAGLTLYSLSRAYHVPVSTLMKANGITDPSTIPAGTPIFIPGARSLLDVPAPVRPALAWPLAGTVTSRFRSRGGSHRGLDIDGEKGDPIRAAAAGTVLRAGKDGRYGLSIVIRHGNGIETLYAHASVLLVREGDRVERSQKIARVGESGNARGTHLHFEVRLDGRAVNPGTYLQASSHMASRDR